MNIKWSRASSDRTVFAGCHLFPVFEWTGLERRKSFEDLLYWWTLEKGKNSLLFCGGHRITINILLLHTLNQSPPFFFFLIGL